MELGTGTEGKGTQIEWKHVGHQGKTALVAGCADARAWSWGTGGLSTLMAKVKGSTGRGQTGQQNVSTICMFTRKGSCRGEASFGCCLASNYRRGLCNLSTLSSSSPASVLVPSPSHSSSKASSPVPVPCTQPRCAAST